MVLINSSERSLKMDTDRIMERLERLENALMAKGHHMQDYSTVKTGLLDLIDILKDLVNGKGGKNA